MKKMLFSAIAMTALTISANAQDCFVPIGNLDIHCTGGAAAAVAELDRLGISDVQNPKTGEWLYLSTYNNTYNACVLDKKSLKQNNTKCNLN